MPLRVPLSAGYDATVHYLLPLGYMCLEIQGSNNRNNPQKWMTFMNGTDSLMIADRSFVLCSLSTSRGVATPEIFGPLINMLVWKR